MILPLIIITQVLGVILAQSTVTITQTVSVPMATILSMPPQDTVTIMIPVSNTNFEPMVSAIEQTGRRQATMDQGTTTSDVITGTESFTATLTSGTFSTTLTGMVPITSTPVPTTTITPMNTTTSRMPTTTTTPLMTTTLHTSTTPHPSPTVPAQSNAEKVVQEMTLVKIVAGILGGVMIGVYAGFN